MSNYWRNRELEHIKRSMKSDKEVADRLGALYQQTLDDAQAQIERFYGRYANKEGLTIQQARKAVSDAEIERYERKAKRYVKQRDFSPQANREMRLYNLKMKINRLELLQAEIRLEMLALYSDEARIIGSYLAQGAANEFKRQSGILGHTINRTTERVKSVVDASFLNAHWSDRIWNNQAMLRAELDVLINNGITQGRNPKVLARELRKTMDVGKYNSERLLVTETARVQTDVQKESLIDSGYDEYEYIAQMDSRTSKVCKSLDGKVFKVKDMEPGKNAPPAHPFCRSSIAAYVSRDDFEKDLKRRGL